MNIEELIEKLCKKKPVAIQKEAIEKLTYITDEELIMLVRPKDKSYWENAAQVLITIGYPRTKMIIPELFEWIADINWPGADIIFSFLSTLEKATLMPFIEEACIKAKQNEDDEWLFYIKLLTRKLKIKEADYNNHYVYEILEKISE